MSLFAPKSEKEFELQPEGTHIARCISLIQLGTHHEEYMGQPKDFNKIRLSFELPTEMRVYDKDKGEQPMLISNDYTLSMNEKANLRKIVEGIIGKSMVDGEADLFDLESLVGKAFLITIKHKTSITSGKTFANIAGASPLMKGMTAPDQINPSKVLTFEHFDHTIFESLPKFIKEKVASSKEYLAIGTIPLAGDDFDQANTEMTMTDEEMEAIN